MLFKLEKMNFTGEFNQYNRLDQNFQTQNPPNPSYQQNPPNQPENDHELPDIPIDVVIEPIPRKKNSCAVLESKIHFLNCEINQLKELLATNEARHQKEIENMKIQYQDTVEILKQQINYQNDQIKIQNDMIKHLTDQFTIISSKILDRQNQ